MSVSLPDLEQQARALSPDNHARLVEVLLESLHEPLTEVETAWNREIDARAAAYDRDELQTFSAEDIFAQAARGSR